MNPYGNSLRGQYIFRSDSDLACHSLRAVS